MIRLQEVRATLLAIALCVSVINDVRVALCQFGDVFTTSGGGGLRGKALLTELETSGLLQAGNAGPFYTQDECFVAGSGMTKYRYPTKTFNTQNIPHSEEAPSFVVGVLSTGDRPQDRTKVRQSWALGHSNVFFLVAGNWTRELEREFQEYQDLIYFEAPEAYRMLTLKVLAFLQAVKKHLPEAMILKTDDDSYVRMTEIADTARKNLNKALYRGGGCKANSKVAREHDSPWYLNRTMYEPDTYPPYAYGGGYIWSPQVNQCAIRAMEKRTSDAEVFPIEDALIAILLQDGCPEVKCDSKFSYQTWSTLKPPDRRPRDIKDRTIAHQVKTTDLMLGMHEYACCRQSIRHPWKFDPVSCADIKCPKFIAFRNQKDIINSAKQLAASAAGGTTSLSRKKTKKTIKAIKRTKKQQQRSTKKTLKK